MRYGISNWIYGDEPLDRTFERLSRFGYEAIELVGEPQRYDVLQVNALSDKHGVAVTSVLGWCIDGIPGRDLATPNDQERAAARQYGRDCIDLAEQVGAPYVVVIPAPAGRTAPVGNPRDQESWETAYQQEWENAVDSVRQTARYAADKGVTLAIEPINRYESFLVTNLTQAMDFIRDIDEANVKVHLDTFHMNLEEADPAGAVRKAGGELVNLHVADSNRQAPGRGHFDFEALLDALMDIGYEGVLALEPVPPGSDPLLVSTFPKNRSLRDTYAREGIAHLSGLEPS